jgi:hypothetical protein
VRLTTSPPSVSWFSRQDVILNVTKSFRTPRPLIETAFIETFPPHPFLSSFLFPSVIFRSSSVYLLLSSFSFILFLSTSSSCFVTLFISFLYNHPFSFLYAAFFLSSFPYILFYCPFFRNSFTLLRYFLFCHTLINFLYIHLLIHIAFPFLQRYCHVIHHILCCLHLTVHWSNLTVCCGCTLPYLLVSVCCTCCDDSLLVPHMLPSFLCIFYRLLAGRISSPAGIHGWVGLWTVNVLRRLQCVDSLWNKLKSYTCICVVYLTCINYCKFNAIFWNELSIESWKHLKYSHTHSMITVWNTWK